MQEIEAAWRVATARPGGMRTGTVVEAPAASSVPLKAPL